jgi:hypothetical protein
MKAGQDRKGGMSSQVMEYSARTFKSKDDSTVHMCGSAALPGPLQNS